MAMRAPPAPSKAVRMLAKSRFTRPGRVMSSLIPWMPWRNTSSATRSATSKVISRPTSGSRRSLEITMREWTYLDRAMMPASAMRRRRGPSKEKGRVTAAIVRVSCSLAMCATTGAAPVPVPPPMPAAMNTTWAPRSAWRMASWLSSAARVPHSGSPPTPNPLATRGPS